MSFGTALTCREQKKDRGRLRSRMPTIPVANHSRRTHLLHRKRAFRGMGTPVPLAPMLWPVRHIPLMCGMAGTVVGRGAHVDSRRLIVLSFLYMPVASGRSHQTSHLPCGSVRSITTLPAARQGSGRAAQNREQISVRAKLNACSPVLVASAGPAYVRPASDRDGSQRYRAALQG